MPDETKTASEVVGALEVISHQNIYDALSAFQGELKSVPRTKKVSYKEVNFLYAPLDEIANYLYPILAKHGLSYRHEINEKGVECILMHQTRSISGQVIESITDQNSDREIRKFNNIVENELRSGSIKIRTDGRMQDVGGDITYARRYTLALVTGIVTDDDNDIREESKTNTKKFALSQASSAIKSLTTEDELNAKILFFEAEIAMIKDKKAPKLGLDEASYKELIKIANAKIADLKSDVQ